MSLTHSYPGFDWAWNFKGECMLRLACEGTVEVRSCGQLRGLAASQAEVMAVKLARYNPLRPGVLLSLLTEC